MAIETTIVIRSRSATGRILRIALPISLHIVPQINFITNNIFLATWASNRWQRRGITGVYYLIFAVIGNAMNNGLQALIARLRVKTGSKK